MINCFLLINIIIIVIVIIIEHSLPPHSCFKTKQKLIFSLENILFWKTDYNFQIPTCFHNKSIAIFRNYRRKKNQITVQYYDIMSYFTHKINQSSRELKNLHQSNCTSKLSEKNYNYDDNNKMFSLFLNDFKFLLFFKKRLEISVKF